MRLSVLALAIVTVVSVGCRGPIPSTDPSPPAGGTIAGIVTTSDRAIAVPGRKITVVNVDTGTRHDTTTATNGGYTIKVPEGTYRIEIELRPAEALVKQPDSTTINSGDLDPGRDFDYRSGGARTCGPIWCRTGHDARLKTACRCVQS